MLSPDNRLIDYEASMVKVSEYSYIKEHLVDEAKKEFELTKKFSTPPRQLESESIDHLTLQINDLEQKIYQLTFEKSGLQ